MNIRYCSVIAAALALAACQSPMQTSTASSTSVQQPMQPAANAPAHHTPAPTPAVATTPAASKEKIAHTQKFECKKGMTATVKHLGNDTISLAVDTIGAEIKLTRVVSGSGVRYLNDKGFYNKSTEWHQKGKEGHLTFKDPYGNEVETVCATK